MAPLRLEHSASTVSNLPLTFPKAYKERQPYIYVESECRLSHVFFKKFLTLWGFYSCERWLQPPAHWITASPESRELLALCLRKLRGLSKVRIIDASFIWTEPHSRRIKVKITIQQEAFQGTILQQTFEVEYVVAYHQCPDCAKSFTANTWRAVVQVRQKVPHKRTFLYLEQLILKHSAHKDTINM